MFKAKLIAAIFVVIALAGCSANNGLPTAVPTADFSPSISPRVDAPPTPGLPPTWTPQPVTSGVHLPNATTSVSSGNSSGSGSASTGIDTSGWERYVVQRGDTLGEIAKQFGTSVSALAEANGITNIDVIEVGTELLVPPSE